MQADFASYRKRALRDQQVAGERAKAVVVSQLLTVLDDLDRRPGPRRSGGGPLDVRSPTETDRRLTGLGLTAFGAEGDEFDPSLHESQCSTRARATKPGDRQRDAPGLLSSATRCCGTPSSGVVDAVDEVSAESDTPAQRGAIRLAERRIRFITARQW